MNQEQLEKAKKLFFILLSVDIVINAIAGFNSFSTVEILKNVQSGTRSLDQSLINSVDFWDKFSMLTMLTLIGVGLGLVKWLNSCYGFAKESIGATGFKNEKWTVAGWIIPVFNLFKPYQVINEIYKAGSQNYSKADDWKKENGSCLLLTWWIFWAVTHFFMWIFGKEILKKSLRGDLTLPQIIGLYEIQVWLFVFSILVAALWFIVAENLTQRFLNRSTKTSRNTVSVDDDHSYKTAYEEMSSGQFQTATWAKAFANAEGNQDKAKALYIKYRVEQLSALPVQQPQAVSSASGIELPAQHEVAGSVYGENKSAIAVIVVVGLVGVGLLVSQMQKSSTNPTQNSLVITQSQSKLTIEGNQSSNQTTRELKPAIEKKQSNIFETRYQDSGDGTVKDTITNLQWMRCSLGQEWTINTCIGKPYEYQWDIALSRTKDLNQNSGYAGYRDWRVPSPNELITLVYCSSDQPKKWNNTGKICEGNYDKPTIDSQAFPNTPAGPFWSSSLYTIDPSKGISVGFHVGYLDIRSRGHENYVRLVRDIQ